MTEPKYVEQTLAWCNARRKEQGKEPLKRLPKGLRRDARSCPCGKATNLEVFIESAYGFDSHGDYSTQFRVPLTVQRFIIAFDSGKLPQYNEKVQR